MLHAQEAPSAPAQTDLSAPETSASDVSPSPPRTSPSDLVQQPPQPLSVEAPTTPENYVDRSGMVELVFWQSLNGLFAGTLLSSAAFGGDTHKWCVLDQSGSAEATKKCKDVAARSGGVVALGLAAGIAGPLLAVRKNSLRTADALLVNRASLIGLMHGYILSFAAGLQPLTDDPVVYEVDVKESRWLSGLTFVGDIAGIAAGSYLAHAYDPEPGFVSLVGTVHLTAFMAAMSVGTSIPDKLKQKNMRLISAVSLGVADLAMAATYYYADRIDIGRNLVFWLDTGALVGWAAGAGLGSLIAGSEERAVSIGGTLGMAAGLIITYLVTERSEPWRKRVDPADVGFHAKNFELLAPQLSVRPVTNGHGEHGLVYGVDILRGRF